MFGFARKKEVEDLQRRLETVESEIRLLTRVGAGSMEVEVAKEILEKIEGSVEGVRRLTPWEKNFLSDLKKYHLSGKFITANRSVKLQEIYRRVIV